MKYFVLLTPVDILYVDKVITECQYDFQHTYWVSFLYGSHDLKMTKKGSRGGILRTMGKALIKGKREERIIF